ncbi:MAG: hypothetical protein R3E55_08315 [Burkholderiaceae bacterium]
MKIGFNCVAGRSWQHFKASVRGLWDGARAGGRFMVNCTALDGRCRCRLALNRSEEICWSRVTFDELAVALLSKIRTGNSEYSETGAENGCYD